MATMTFLELRNRSREESDMVYSDFVTENELKFYVNSSLKELYDLLVATYADYYEIGPVQFTLTGTESTFQLPDDFYKMRSMQRNITTSPNQWFTVHKFNMENMNQFNQFNYVSGTYPLVKYRVFGSPNLNDNGYVQFIPEQSAQGLYRYFYVPQCPKLVDDDDVYNGINGWEEYIIVDCAIKMLAKQEDDVSVFMQRKRDLISRIEAMAADRDAGEPEKIADIRSTSYYGPFGGGGFGGW